MKMAKTNREREREAREAKLEHMRELVSSGVLVIREMTNTERTKWAKRRAKLDITQHRQNAVAAMLPSGICVDVQNVSPPSTATSLTKAHNVPAAGRG